MNEWVEHHLHISRLLSETKITADSLMENGLDNQQNGMLISLLVAVGVTTIRAMREKQPFLAALMDIIIAGFLAPTVVWLFWKDAPFFVYGLIAAVVSRYPDLIKVAASSWMSKSDDRDINIKIEK